MDKIEEYRNKIKESGCSIYDRIDEKSDLWINDKDLEKLLNKYLKGLSLNNMPLRTRSKFINQKICEALGYPIPKSFKKTNPRFPAQNFDKFLQKSNNLQIWNDEIVPNRRYVVIKINENDIIEKIKVIRGIKLSIYDKTGTLTQKYQARMNDNLNNVTKKLISPIDTKNVINLTNPKVNLSNFSPTNLPNVNELLPIKKIFDRLISLIGKTIPYGNPEQERKRGDSLHKLICNKLGYNIYKENGQFPDILHQLIEVKLQTSPTIDLGLYSPDDNETEILTINNISITPSDIRYVIFGGIINDNNIKLTNLFVTTGKDFFTYFTKFKGKGINKKLQIPLPKDFF